MNKIEVIKVFYEEFKKREHMYNNSSFDYQQIINNSHYIESLEIALDKALAFALGEELFEELMEFVYDRENNGKIEKFLQQIKDKI